MFFLYLVGTCTLFCSSHHHSLSLWHRRLSGVIFCGVSICVTFFSVKVVLLSPPQLFIGEVTSFVLVGVSPPVAEWRCRFSSFVSVCPAYCLTFSFFDAVVLLEVVCECMVLWSPYDVGVAYFPILFCVIVSLALHLASCALSHTGICQFGCVCVRVFHLFVGVGHTFDLRCVLCLSAFHVPILPSLIVRLLCVFLLL